jgi:arabinofuranan 3-O-arabinosyltransferase
MTTAVLESAVAPAQARAQIVRWRLRYVAACAVIVAVCFNSDAGRLAGDTKLDLTVDPVGFLARALHLWNGQAFAGQLQNQAYGYLFPMGPFFVLGHLAGLPGWVVQRLWWSALLCTAFLGMARLAERLGVGSEVGRFIGGLAYAGSPHLVTSLGAVSAEALPMCLTPWVLVPLVDDRHTPRRAAALSALAVLAMGAVNAAAVGAALIPALLWLLLHLGDRRGRAVAGWWVAAVAVVTAWWVVPLLLLGRYSVNFLDHIESAVTTTSITSAVEALRGTADWVAYLPEAGWRAGQLYLTQSAILLNSVLIVSLGLAGLALRDMPQRRWAVLSLVVGVCTVGFGFHADAGWVHGFGADQFRSLLDGGLAPLRNTHKFDVVLRLPLVLGLVHLLGRAEWGRSDQERRSTRALATALVVVIVAGTAAPLISLKLAPSRTFGGLPGYWHEAADWLADDGRDARALIVPGAHTGLYVWGRTGDEPLQALARSEWEVRDSVPIVPSGHIRALDAVEQLFDAGRPSPGLADYLRRMGIGYLVVRNDVDFDALGAPRPVLVHQTLDGSPGLRRVAAFGPPFGQLDIGVDAGLQPKYPPVEIYRVAGGARRVLATTEHSAALVSGGPESLLGLDATVGAPAVLAGDVTTTAVVDTGTVVLTDGLRRRETNYGLNTDNRSATLTATDPLRLRAASRDYLPYTGEKHQTLAVLHGASSVTASSSGSDPDAGGGSVPAEQPFAAIDGAPDTGWRANFAQPADGQWWQVGFSPPRVVPDLTLLLPDLAGLSGTATVRTDAGQETVRIGPGASVPVSIPAGRPTASVRVTFHVGVGAHVGIQEVAIPDVHVTRSLQVADDLPASRAVDVVSFQAAGDGRSGCVADGEAVRCVPFLVRQGEDDLGLDRTFVLGQAADFGVQATATPRPGGALDRIITQAAKPSVEVTASSQAVAAPLAGPQTTVDGQIGTGWVADPGDTDPTLQLSWKSPRTIDSLRLQLDPGLAATMPTQVVVDPGRDATTLTVSDAGTVAFPAVRTDRLELHLRGGFGLRSTVLIGSDQVVPLGLGVSEIGIPGVTGAAGSAGDADGSVRFGCDAGPQVVLDGATYRTQGTTTVRQLRDLDPIPLTLCDPSVSLSVGQHRMIADRTSDLLVSGVVLTRIGYQPAAQLVVTTTQRWDAAHRTVAVAARPADTVLVVHENANLGWHATLDGRELRRVVVDGWQQGYVVPAGAAGTVHLDFTPDRTYRAALLIGGLLVLALLAALTWGSRRHAKHRRAVPAPARSGGLLLPVAGVVAAGLLAGWAGLAVAALVAAAALALRRRRPAWASAAAPIVAAAGYLAAGLWLVLHHAGTASYAGRSAGPQVLCALALSAVCWSDLAAPSRVAASSAPRPTGSSTSR